MMSPTSPSTTSTRALYLSNWQDMVGIWMAGKLTQNDQTQAGPRLGELHSLQGSLASRNVNQIVDYTGYFRDETNNVKYTAAGNFDTEAWFENGATNAGVLTANYLTYSGAAMQPSLQLSRSFAGPPNQPFFVVRYSLTNPTGQSITFNVLDQVRLNNLDNSKNVHAWYDATNNAFIADMTASGQLFVILGALKPVTGYQVGNEADTNTSSATVAGWTSFDSNGSLANNGDLTAPRVDMAFNTRVTVDAGATQTIYFYIGVCQTQAEATSAIAAGRGSTGDAWFSTTAAAYNAWLTNGNQGRRVHFDDDGLNQMYDRALITIRNVQNPVTGAFCATTNPFQYGYKDWVRDSAVASIALDASGHFAEAESHWRWLASCQGSDGSWKTTYDMWDSTYVPFVEPEYDSIGAFIYGVYRHYTQTADTTFLGDLWPNVKRAADWILTNIQPNGFGQADYSIWEEMSRGLEHNIYTQAWFVVGLYATQCMAEALGDTPLTEWYAGGAASIMTAMQRPATWNPPGLWDPASYYNRAVNADNSIQPLIDSSSNMAIALGAIDFESSRATSHVTTILNTLTKQNYGLCRYLGDVFYYTDPWSPGGNEALAPEPSWPQMSIWAAVYEMLTGQTAKALARLQWCTSVFGKGYMPPGEAVSNVTLQPLISTMCEPLTAASFVIGALIDEGQYTLGAIPPLYNASAAKTINVSFATAGDWGQWTNVPYFKGPQTRAGATPTCQIKRAYITNDYANLYLRIDNVAGSFAAYQAQPLFSLRVYSQDFSGSGVSGNNLSESGSPLRRPMNYMVERHSDSDAFQHWSTSGGNWFSDWTVIGVIAPQWDPVTGKLEAVIPISCFSSGGPVFGSNWTDVLVVLASFDQSTSTWKEGDSMLLHYQLATPYQNWIYGNIEQ
jgi:GH15 family glucan-1,4-alpha-glucosidase